MDYVELLFQAIKDNELILFLRGDKFYKIEPSQYAPGTQPTDVGRVLSDAIYKGYKIKPDIKEKFEDALLIMLNRTTFDLYVVILYVVSQLFKEKNNLSPFKLEVEEILPKIREEIRNRRTEMEMGIKYSDGYEKKMFGMK